MKIAKIIAGMSALSIAAAMAAVPAYAESAPEENSYYPASHDVTYVYSGADIAAACGDAVIDPEANDSRLEGKSAQLVGYTNKETGNVDTYNLGFNFQVGHENYAKITIEVTSSANNIYDGNGGTGSGYMYTVQTSWKGNTPADDQQGWVKYQYEDDGTTQKTAWGAADIVDMDMGKTKFNGNWAQLTLTDTDVSALTFTVHVDCSNSQWEYHPWSAESESGNVYEVFILANGCAAPTNVDDTLVQQNEQGYWGVVPVDTINAQIPGGVTSGSTDSSSASDSSSTGSNSDSSSSSSSSSSTSSGSGTTSSKSSTSSTKSTTSTAKTTTTTTTTTSTASTASDNTENAASGAAAGVGLALAAIAGAAIVVSRKR